MEKRRKEYDNLTYKVWTVLDDEAYFSVLGFPCIMKYSFITGSLNLVYVEKSLDESESLFICYKVGKYIFAFPDWGKTIIRYDTEAGMVSKCLVQDDVTLGIFEAYYLKEKLYVYACRAKLLYIIDPYKLTVVDKVKIPAHSERNILKLDSIRTDKRIYMTTGCGSVAVYDAETNELRNLNLFTDNIETCDTLAKYENRLVVGGSKQGIVYIFEELDKEFKLIKKIEVYDENRSEDFMIFQKFIVKNDRLWIISNYMNEVLYVELLGNDEKIHRVLPQNEGRSTKPVYMWDSQYTFLCEYDDYILIQDKCNCEILKIHTKQLLIERTDIHITQSDKYELIKERKMFFEDMQIGLIDFLGLMK